MSGHPRRSGRCLPEQAVKLGPGGIAQSLRIGRRKLRDREALAQPHQPHSVSQTRFVPLGGSTPTRDDLAEVVDYDYVRQVIARRVARGHIVLQETLCDDLMAELIAHPGVVAVRLSSCKPDVYPDCEGVGVEIIRIKGNASW